MAKLVDETTSKSARFQTAQTVLSSPPAVLSNLSRHNGASLNRARVQAPTSATITLTGPVVDPIGKNARIQTVQTRSGKPLSATLLLHRANDRYQVCRDRSSAGCGWDFATLMCMAGTTTELLLSVFRKSETHLSTSLTTGHKNPFRPHEPVLNATPPQYQYLCEHQELA